MHGSVPGKLMIAGEHAVLSGACPALAVAVGGVARWSLGQPGPNRVQIAAFGQVWAWQAPAEAPRGIGQLVQRCVNAATEAGWAPTRELRLAIDGQIGGIKVGLGTSAATVVATLRACAAAAPIAVAEDELIALAHCTHRAAQGGKGSGYDIGTIATGGTVTYDRPTATARRLRWPTDLCAAALFTGSPASTERAIRTPLSDSVLRRIAQSARTLLDCWGDPTARTILNALQSCEQAFIEASGVRASLDPPPLRRARQWIQAQGCVARVSGAGGGDCILAFADDPQRIDAVVALWQDEGNAVVATLPGDIAD